MPITDLATARLAPPHVLGRKLLGNLRSHGHLRLLVGLSLRLLHLLLPMRLHLNAIHRTNTHETAYRRVWRKRAKERNEVTVRKQSWTCVAFTIPGHLKGGPPVERQGVSLNSADIGACAGGERSALLNASSATSRCWFASIDLLIATRPYPPYRCQRYLVCWP